MRSIGSCGVRSRLLRIACSSSVSGSSDQISASIEPSRTRSRGWTASARIARISASTSAVVLRGTHPYSPVYFIAEVADGHVLHGSSPSDSWPIIIVINDSESTLVASMAVYGIPSRK